MNKQNQYVLYELDKKQNTILSRLIANYYIHQVSTEEPFKYFSEKFNTLNKDDKPSELLDIAPVENRPSSKQLKDFRISYLSLSNFRRFPDLKIPCGLKLERDGNPVSLILLGGNGVGKSSLYAAFEYVLVGNISEALLRNHDKERFASHSNSPSLAEQHHIQIKMPAYGLIHNYEEFKQIANSLDLSTFFCSEWDIISIGRNDVEKSDELKYSFHDFFASNLGFAELIELKKIVYRLKSIASDLMDNADEIQSLEDKLKNCANQKAELRALMFNFPKSEIKQAISKYTKILGNMKKSMKSSIEKLNENFTFAIPIEWSEKNRSNFYMQMNNNLKMIMPLYRKVQVVLQELDAFQRLADRLDATPMIEAFRQEQYNLRNIIEDIENLIHPTDGIGQDLSKSQLQSFQNLAYSQFNPNKIYMAYLNMCSDVKKDMNRLMNINLRASSDKDLDNIITLEVEYHELERKLLQAKEAQSRNNYLKLKEEADLYYRDLEKYLDEKANEIFSDVKDTISRVMKIFMSRTDKEELNIDNKNDKNKISVEIRFAEYKGENSNEKCEYSTLCPQTYYNTFRYKLFCMMLKVSVALAIMKHFNINFPIILDDVFYASDYHNRKQITQFMRELFKSYTNIVGHKEPMQLICFTHDEIVLEAIRSAAVSDSKRHEMIFGRLVDYKGLLDDVEDAFLESYVLDEKQNHVFNNLYIELFK